MEWTVKMYKKTKNVFIFPAPIKIHTHQPHWPTSRITSLSLQIMMMWSSHREVIMKFPYRKQIKLPLYKKNLRNTNHLWPHHHHLTLTRPYRIHRLPLKSTGQTTNKIYQTMSITSSRKCSSIAGMTGKVVPKGQDKFPFCNLHHLRLMITTWKWSLAWILPAVANLTETWQTPKNLTILPTTQCQLTSARPTTRRRLTSTNKATRCRSMDYI